MATLSPHRLSRVALAISTLVLLTFWLYYHLSTPLSVERLGEGDMALYNVGVLHQANPDLYQRDYFYSDGVLFQNLPPAFIGLMAFLYRQVGGLSLAAAWFLRVALAIYLPGMMLFLWRVTRHWPLALGVTIISASFAGLAITGEFWGIAPPTVALVLYTAVAPWVFWLVLWSIDVPADDGRSRTLWSTLGRVAVLGLLIGLTQSVHPVSALGVAEIVGGLLLVQVLRRELAWPVLPVYVVALLPGLAPQIYSAGSFQVSFESASVFFAQQSWADSMVFPWPATRMNPAHWLSVHPETIMALLLIAYVVSSTVSGLFAWRATRRPPSHPLARWREPFRSLSTAQLWLLIFLAVQTAFTLALVRMGSIPWLMLLYGWFRLRRAEFDRRDSILLTLVVLCLLGGPVQQMVFRRVWATLQLTALSGVMVEMARFSRFIFLPLWAFVALSLEPLTALVKPTALRYGVLVALLLVAGENLDRPAGVSGIELAFLGLVVVLLAWPMIERRNPFTATDLLVGAALVVVIAWGLNAFFASRQIEARAPQVILAAVVATIWLTRRLLPLRWMVAGGALLLAGGILVALNMQVTFAGQGTRLGEALTASLPPAASTEQALETDPGPDDYDLLTSWARAETPLDSLFYWDDAAFRVWAERSLIFASYDLSVSLYARRDPVELRARLDRLNAADSPEALIAAVRAYDGDYIVLPADTVFALDLPVAYDNDSYTVYAVVP